MPNLSSSSHDLSSLHIARNLSLAVDDAIYQAKDKSRRLLNLIASILFWTAISLSNISTLINFTAIPLSHLNYLLNYSYLTEILSMTVYNLYFFGYALWLGALVNTPNLQAKWLSAKTTWIVTCILGISSATLFIISCSIPELTLAVSFVELLANFFRVTGNFLDYKESVENHLCSQQEIKKKYKYYIFTFLCTLIPLGIFITCALTLPSPILITLLLLPAAIITGLQLTLCVYSLLYKPLVPEGCLELQPLLTSNEELDNTTSSYQLSTLNNSLTKEIAIEQPVPDGVTSRFFTPIVTVLVNREDNDELNAHDAQSSSPISPSHPK